MSNATLSSASASQSSPIRNGSPTFQTLYIVTATAAISNDENYSASRVAGIQGVDVHSSLSDANQNVAAQAAAFRRETAFTKAQVEALRGMPGWQPSFCEGGEVIEDGSMEDGRAFWVATQFGGGVQEQGLLRCEVARSEVEWGAMERKEVVWVVVASGLKGPAGSADGRIAEAVVEGVYPSMELANGRVREVADGYVQKLNEMADGFGWGEEAYFYNGKVSHTLTKTDGTVVWAGLKKVSVATSEHVTGGVCVYKRSIGELNRA